MVIVSSTNINLTIFYLIGVVFELLKLKNQPLINLDGFRKEAFEMFYVY